MVCCVKFAEVPVWTDAARGAIVEGKGVDSEVRDNVGSLLIVESDSELIERILSRNNDPSLY